MKTRIIAMLGMVVLAVSTLANEPSWTEQERSDHRDLVCWGNVVSIQKVGPIDKNNDLSTAVIEIAGVKKGEKTLAGSRIIVYFESAPSEKQARCPDYAELAKARSGTFYLCQLTDDLRKRLNIATVKDRIPTFFLEMGSDVQETTSARSVSQPVKTAAQELARQAKALLPAGWSANSSNDLVIVRRHEPVRMINNINAPPMFFKDEQSRDQYYLAQSLLYALEITVRLEEPQTAEQLAVQIQKNAAIMKERAAFEGKLKHIPQKFYHYLPTTDADKKLIAEYHALGAGWREIAPWEFNGVSAFTPVQSLGMLDFYSENDSQECARVFASIMSCLKKRQP